MQITGTNSTDPVTSFGSSADPNEALGKDAFMRLLVAQLENQDPLEPVDNTAYVAQLAQFSQLEQAQELNDNVVGLAVLQQTNALLSQLTEGSTLIGQDVSYADPNGGATQRGSVDSLRVVEGIAMLNIDGKDVPLGNVLEIHGEAIAADPDAESAE